MAQAQDYLSTVFTVVVPDCALLRAELESLGLALWQDVRSRSRCAEFDFPVQFRR
jgi:hypothetical protein